MTQHELKELEQAPPMLAKLAKLDKICNFLQDENENFQFYKFLADRSWLYQNETF